LANVAKLKLSTVDKHSLEGELAVQLCNYVDVYKRDVIDRGLLFMEATATHLEAERFQLRKGDVLITKDSENWQDIGVPAFVAEDLPRVLCGYHLAMLTPDASVLNGRFLAYALGSEIIARQFRVRANGVTRFALGLQEIKSVYVPVPPLDIQRQIVWFLMSLDMRVNRLVRAKRRLIELLNEQKQAIIHQAVTRGLDPTVPLKPSSVEWIERIPNHWNETKVKWICRTTSGGTPNTAMQHIYYGGETPWIRTTDLTNDIMTSYEIGITDLALHDTACKVVPPGTVLVAMYGGGGTIGKNGLLSFPAALNQAVCGILPSARLLPEFLLRYMQLQRPFWMVGADGTRKDPNISQGRIRDCIVIEPPVSEQAHIMSLISRRTRMIDRLKLSARSEIDLIGEYRARLVADVVTGQLDVRDHPWAKTHPGEQGSSIEDSFLEEEVEHLLDTEALDM
jgi:type I restriction enzyme, S subunit